MSSLAMRIGALNSERVELTETAARASGRLCGVDEAGRGPLAGPVVAGAVLLDPARPISGLRDSKQLSASRRAELAALIRERSLAWAVAHASAEEIDQFNILQASLLAMRRAVEALKVAPEFALIDGNQLPRLSIPARALIGGDQLEATISAASILAKTTRDALMLTLHADYPGYGFARHMGYATREHLECLRRLGPCAQHRQSFAPVRQWRAAAVG